MKFIRDKRDVIQTFLPPVIFLSIAYLLYLKMFSGVWLMDDLPVVVNNPDIRSISNFFENYYPGRPLREISFLVDYYFFGLNSSGYYLQHIFWHGLCAWLVYFLAKQLGAAIPVAWSAALIFLFHPVQVEVVANNSHRKDSLALAFCLISFCLYLQGRSQKLKNKKWFIYALVAWGVALLAKQNALALPIVVVLYELFLVSFKQKQKYLLNGLIIFSTVFVALLVWQINTPEFKDSIGQALSKLGFSGSASLETYYLTVCKAWALMWSKLLYPVNLSMEYTFSVPESWSDIWVASGIMSVITMAIGLFLSGKHNALIFVSTVWLFAFWLPTSNLLGHLSYFAADRYWYAPIVGASIIVAYALWKLLRENILAYVMALVIILSTFGMLTIRQQVYWCDEFKFYKHMLEVNPNALEGLVGLGNILMHQGNHTESIKLFKKAYLKNSRDSRIVQNLGFMAYNQGEHQKALSYFQRAIELDPNLLEAYNNLGSLYDDLGQSQKAIEVLNQALKINPHFEKAYTNMGVVYERIGQLGKAAEMHKRAITERPDYAQGHYNLGNTLYKSGRKKEAMSAYALANQLDPKHVDALYNYAVVADELGKKRVTEIAINKLRGIDPKLANQLQQELY